MLLQLENIGVAFAGRAVLEGLNLSIDSNEWVGLVGPNGGGKTTVLNVVSRLINPQSGRIHFDGRNITRLSPDRLSRLGVVRMFQTPYVNRRVTVNENVDLHLGGPYGRAERERISVQRALQAVGLSSISPDLPSPVDRFRARLVEIARALVVRPRLVLLDEPAAGLDPSERSRLKEALEALRANGTAVILVEHDHEFVRSLSSRILTVQYGRLQVVAREPESRSDRVYA